MVLVRGCRVTAQLNVPVNLDLSILKYNLQRILGEPLQVPPNYVVFDLETTALTPEEGKIWQIGVHMHLNGKDWDAAPHGLSMLVRTEEKDLLANRFEIERLAHVRMESNDETLEQAIASAEQQYLRRFSSKTPPVERMVALKEAARLLESCMKKGYPIVGHNLASFDIPFFEHECAEAGILFKFPDANVIDTGMFIKSAQTRRRVLDTEYYRPRAFYQRVRDERRKGAIYALERFCLYYWRLDRKYGVNMAHAHDAGYDCWVTSLVLQELVNTAMGGINYVHGPGSLPRGSADAATD